METADEPTIEIEKQQSHAVGFGRRRTNDNQQKESSSGQPKPGVHNVKCGLCGGKYPHQGICPAQGSCSVTSVLTLVYHAPQKSSRGK